MLPYKLNRLKLEQRQYSTWAQKIFSLTRRQKIVFQVRKRQAFVLIIQDFFTIIKYTLQLTAAAAALKEYFFQLVF